MDPTNAPVKADILDTATTAQVNDYVCLISQIRRTYHNYIYIDLCRRQEMFVNSNQNAVSVPFFQNVTTDF